MPRLFALLCAVSIACAACGGDPPASNRTGGGGDGDVSAGLDFDGGAFDVDAIKGPCYELLDTTGDGVPDSIRGYEYNGIGQAVRERYDADKDGNAENLIKYTYNAGGKVSQREMDGLSGAVDSYIDFRETYEYDGQGRLVGGEQDAGADGRIERTFSVVSGPHGPTETSWYDQSNSALVARETNTYNEQGKVVRIDRDENGDRYADLSIEYTYDDAGNSVREITDRAPLGSPNIEARHEYDANGRREWTRFDNGPDGTIDGTTQYFYDCYLRGGSN